MARVRTCFAWSLVCVLMPLSTAFAELAEDSPAYLTGTIVSASRSVVTLKLADGRQTAKIPRTAFAKSTDFYPGRIVTLKVTDELRRALAPTATVPDLSEAELMKMIKAVRRSGMKKLRTSAFDFLGIRDAHADGKCKPVNALGNPMIQQHPGGPCDYELAESCKDQSSEKAALKANPGAKVVAACNPFLYGTGICAPVAGEPTAAEGACEAIHAKRCAGLSEDDCIRRYVLPYAKENKQALKDYFGKLAVFCAKDGAGNFTAPNVDPGYCDAFKKAGELTEAEFEKAAKDYRRRQENDRGRSGCVLAEDDLNKNLSDKVDDPARGARFTTVSAGSLCADVKLCVRDIGCLADIGGAKTVVKRFARCRAENCNSAQACLDDTLVAGSSRKSSVPGASSGKGN